MYIFNHRDVFDFVTRNLFKKHFQFFPTPAVHGLTERRRESRCEAAGRAWEGDWRANNSLQLQLKV